ncbi:cytochrome c3 family protein [Desulfurivibrio sp. D14AmB]|uniref:cytochrome c3 family protein n=1 Tax=Desulfurivibrio sp. D14AmB TaxID=3374370 RepID=UPI00376EBEB5
MDRPPPELMVRRWQPSPGLALLLAALIWGTAGLGAAGCSPETRHNTLTIFFTGVPPLVAPHDPELTAADQLLAAAPLLPQRHELGGFVHGPYGARECGVCHEMAPASNPEVKSTRIAVGRFARPRDEMCVACHSEKGAERARREELWLHGPAARDCLGCHHPHASGQPALLRHDPTQACLRCHGPGLIHNMTLHEGLSDCLECHNAHLGRDAMMLKADYQEIF